MKKYVILPESKIAMYGLNLLPYVDYYLDNKPNNKILIKNPDFSLFNRSKVSNKVLHNIVIRSLKNKKIPYTESTFLWVFLMALAKLGVIKIRGKNDAKNDEDLYENNNSLLTVMPQYLTRSKAFHTNEPFCVMSDKEQKRGKEILLSKGIDIEESHVTAHARDDEFHNTKKAQWDHRNTEFKSILQALSYLSEKNIYSYRMGAVQKKYTKDDLRLPHKVIDYTSLFRSEFMDIYLISNAKFHIEDTSGLMGVPYLFNVPQVNINYIPIFNCQCRKDDLWIPKKLWLIKEKRFMKFSEILSMDRALFINSSFYKDSGIEVVDNSEHEILSVVKEMNDKIDGKIIYSEEDEEVQVEFKNLFDKNDVTSSATARLGRSFLYENLELLR